MEPEKKKQGLTKKQGLKKNQASPRWFACVSLSQPAPKPYLEELNPLEPNQHQRQPVSCLNSKMCLCV